jgi:hypothetical protein
MGNRTSILAAALAAACGQSNSLTCGAGTVQSGKQCIAVTPDAGVTQATVVVAPATAQLPPNGAQAFTATVLLATSGDVTWSVEESGCGTVDAAGRFTAPGKAATCHVVAASVADPSKTARAAVTVSAPCDWTQWGGDATHRGVSCSVGQSLSKSLFQTVFDPFTDEEQTDAFGDLLAHYQSPLLAGDDVYMELKGGTFTPCRDPDTGAIATPTCYQSQTWGEQYFHWENGQLVQKWTFPSDWKPETADLAPWEPVFHAAIHGDELYVPGFGGTVYKVNRKTGAQEKQINPFGNTIDGTIYVAGPLTIDSSGNVYYNAVKLDATDPVTNDVGGAWLVKITPQDVASTVTFATLVPDAPAGESCLGTFVSQHDDGMGHIVGDPLPWPPAADAVPAAVNCGGQRPGINAAPAVGDDGTIFTVSRAHHVGRYSYVVAVNPNLTPKWHRSLRDYLNDGCGVTVLMNGPSNSSTRRCRYGTTVGVEPSTNQRPAGVVNDTSSSSPVALPDGGVLYGSLTGYNGSRGHLFKISASGSVQGSYDFGWDVTPAVWSHDGTYSIITKDNHYGFYYDMTQLDASLMPEWKLRSTNPQDCSRDDQGNVHCVVDPASSEAQLGGFEWCVNAPVVDPYGNVFANSEDGRVYSITQGGLERAHLFLLASIGAAYTPLSIDAAGRIYSLNLGTMTVIGN